MKLIYFTKTLRGHTVEQMVEFLKRVGLDGADLAVRPGYPVNPDNVVKQLPLAVRTFADASLSVPLVSAPTNMADPAAAAERLFAAAGQSNVLAVKIGYFPFRGNFRHDLEHARKRLAGFAKLAEKHNVRACYHTHSGQYVGSNAAGMLQLLRDLDPHHVGAFLDAGHQAVGGSPIQMAVDMIAPHLALVSVKDMVWYKDDKDRWRRKVVPAPSGIVQWQDLANALKRANFDGPVSVHAEYHTKDIAQRITTVTDEVKFFRKLFGLP